MERRARRRELLLTKAIELAFARRELMMKLVDRSGQELALRDDVSIAADYFAELTHLLEKNELSASFREKEVASRKKRVDRLKSDDAG